MLQVSTSVADVRNLQPELPRQLALYAEAPGVGNRYLSRFVRGLYRNRG